MIRFLSILFVFLVHESAHAQPSPEFGSVLRTPCDFGGAIVGEQGLIVVPENRSKSDSRAIAVHFLRFPATKRSVLPPVFILPGGPGGSYDESSIAGMGRLSKDRFSVLMEIRRYSENRDVFVVNHRGNSKGPGLQSESLHWTLGAGKLDTARSIDTLSRRAATDAKRAFDHWSSRGMDLSGYDIINMVEDIDDLRVAFQHDKIALRGNSFGSQWSFAYMKAHPDKVDRALLTAIEPLNHAYDSPQGIWNVFERLEQQVIAEGKLKLPSEGLLGAVKVIVEKLETRPVVVKGRHPSRGFTKEIPIGVDDFREYLLSGLNGNHRTDRRTREAWPKFVLEIYKGDYQYLASQIMAYRDDPARRTMILTLVDNSLGITVAREKQIHSEPAARWLGDVNWSRVATRSVTPTKVVSDKFRAFTRSEIPVLMVHGDLDISTPIENALDALEHLPNGHLIRIKGGTHAAIRDAVNMNTTFMKHLEEFMNTDFNDVAPSSAYDGIPTSVQLGELSFDELD